MSDYLSILPQIILAQALGVGLAWGADAVSWKWRQDEKIVLAINCLNVVTIGFVVLLCLAFLSFLNCAGVFATALIWLFSVALVQKKQLKVMLYTAFFGVLMQLSCFGWALGAALLLLSFSWPFIQDSLYLTWLVSALLTNALLSLFRPTIYSTWNTWRQNSRKN